MVRKLENARDNNPFVADIQRKPPKRTQRYGFPLYKNTYKNMFDCRQFIVIFLFESSIFSFRSLPS